MSINVWENIWYTQWTIQRHRRHWIQDTERKQAKTTLYGNVNDTQYGPPEKTTGWIRCSQSVRSSCFLKDTHHVTYSQSPIKALSMIKGRTILWKVEKFIFIQNSFTHSNQRKHVIWFRDHQTETMGNLI